MISNPRRLARLIAWKIPPIAQVLRERNELAAENRRLKRELSSPSEKTVSHTEFDPKRFPKKINLGCGFDHRPEYLNVDLNDFHKPDLVANVKNMPMLPSQYYEEILAIDVLEHLHRDDTEIVLKEFARLIVPGGMLHLRVPSLLDTARMMEKLGDQQIDEQKLIIQNLFGTQAYTGDYHYTAFTRPLLTFYLRQAGFEPLKWSLFEGWIFDVACQKR